MKIAMITDWECSSGIYSYSRFLTEQLEKQIDIKIIGVKNPHFLDPIYYSPENFSWKGFLQLLSVVKQTNSAKKQCDIIHFHEPMWVFSPIIYLQLCFASKANIITTVHEIYQDGERKHWVLRLYRYLLEWWIVKKSDAVIVHNQDIVNYFERKGAKKVFFFPLGTLSNPVVLDKEDCKGKMGLGGKKVITIFGYINPRKDYDLILRILPELDNDVVLLIAGGLFEPCSKEQQRCYERLICEQNTTGRVKVTGYLDEQDVATAICASDVMLFPYLHEVQSGALNLALAYKRPSITSDLPYFRAIKEKYGCIDIAQNEGEFLEKIRTFLTVQNCVNKLVTNSQKYWEDNNFESLTDGYIDMYRTVLDE